MMRFRRLRLALIAGACLIMGFAMGRIVPHSGDVRPSGLDGAGRMARGTSPPRVRNVYSPDIRHDAYVRAEQLKVVEMLEQQCRATRENCALAKASREAMTAE